MGKPRLIILIRHAQSEGNKNRDIHQTVPDHRVKLTAEGREQALEAGRKLRELLRPDDTLHFFTSPYRRTRETTEGILKSLTSDHPTPSPFPRHTIKVYEEPRLREQDFGNFQPCSAEMSRMWQERADYGHFFYRIPNGESAADAYDRISGFNESLWRSFSENDFASVCVLVTHGLMTRVFLMKWYHFSVEYFEDLRNVDHCEFVVMKKNEDDGRYVLRNQLRTWSELRAEREQKAEEMENKSPIPIRKKWSGHPDDWGHGFMSEKRLLRRRNTADLFHDDSPTSAPRLDTKRKTNTAKEEPHKYTINEARNGLECSTQIEEHSRNQAFLDGTVESDISFHDIQKAQHRTSFPDVVTGSKSEGGRDGGGSRSGYSSGEEVVNEDLVAAATKMKDYKDASNFYKSKKKFQKPRSMAFALRGIFVDTDEQGMRPGTRADALGDQSDVDDETETLEEKEKEDRSFEGSVH